MHTLKKIYKIVSNCIFYSLLFILCIVTINIVYNRVVKKETLPRVLDYYVFNVKTGSMEPTIHVGEYIIVKKTNDVKVDDIVTFSKEDYFITHRVIKMNGDEIITQGDANNLEDEPITKNDIVGKFVVKSKLIGFIVEYKYFIIGFVVGSYLFSFLFKDKKRKDELDEKED